MIRLINKVIIYYLKKLSVRKQYYTNTACLCFYPCLNKNNISKSMSIKTL